MKLLKSKLGILLLTIFIAGMSSDVLAQDRGAAVQIYNKALELVKAEKYEQAINMYQQAITEGEELGEEGQDIVERSKKKLPEVYYQIGLQNYRTFQKDQSIANLDATIEAFEQTKEAGEEFGNTQIANKAEGLITQFLYTKSIFQYKQQNMNAALATLDKVIERDPNYSKAYYQKGIVTKNMDSKSMEDALALFDKAIEVGKKNNDGQIVSKAKQSVHDELVFQGAKATENKDYDRSVELLNKALSYEAQSSEAHYRLAEAYNKKQDWQKAVNHSEEALGLESGGKTEKAKIYFEMAIAYKGLGQKGKACSAFGNAAYGSFKSPSEHQMEYELKCKSTTN